jgi:HK97 family phage major capsid protein
MGLAIDNLCLNGGASGRPMGIAQHTDVGETASVGSPAWEDILLAIKGIENNHGTPNAYVLSPATKYSYAILVTGDGTNSSKDWLRPPPDVAQLRRFVTPQCPDSKLFLGDFSQMLLGVRKAVEVQTSPVAGDAFAKNQIAIRVVWRGDVVFAHANHFHRLTGIT